MTANMELWAPRVEAWRSSGISIQAYAEQHGWPVHALRYWSGRLKAAETMRARAATPVPIARVERSGHKTLAATGIPVGTMAIEVGTIRVVVGSGFDRVTLSAILDVLSERAR